MLLHTLLLPHSFSPWWIWGHGAPAVSREQQEQPQEPGSPAGITEHLWLQPSSAPFGHGHSANPTVEPIAWDRDSTGGAQKRRGDKEAQADRISRA